MGLGFDRHDCCCSGTTCGGECLGWGQIGVGTVVLEGVEKREKRGKKRHRGRNKMVR